MNIISNFPHEKVTDSIEKLQAILDAENEERLSKCVIYNSQNSEGKEECTR